MIRDSTAVNLQEKECMAFVWKEDKDKFKGEGIYLLTFNVSNRVPLPGKLKPLAFPDAESHIAGEGK